MGADQLTKRKGSEFLSTEEVTELTEEIVRITESNLPLSRGLRAAAGDVSNPRVRTGLSQLADCIEHGKTLDEGLASSGLRIPTYLSGLIQAGARAGKLPEVLLQLTDHYRSSQDQSRQIWSVLFYPLCLIGLMGIVLAIVFFGVVPELNRIYLEFEVELSQSTLSLIWFSEIGWQYVVGAMVSALLIAVLIRVLGGAASWMQVVATIPGFGRIMQWQGFAEFSELLRLLLMQEVPLGESLRLTAIAVRNANVTAVTHELATQVENGRSLADAMVSSDQVPPHMIPVIRMGEQNDRLPDSLRIVYELFEEQIDLRSRLLMSIFPPLMFLLIAGFVVALLLGLFTPLVSLIQYLVF